MEVKDEEMADRIRLLCLILAVVSMSITLAVYPRRPTVQQVETSQETKPYHSDVVPAVHFGPPPLSQVGQGEQPSPEFSNAQPLRQPTPAIRPSQRQAEPIGTGSYGSQSTSRSESAESRSYSDDGFTEGWGERNRRANIERLPPVDEERLDRGTAALPAILPPQNGLSRGHNIKPVGQRRFGPSPNRGRQAKSASSSRDLGIVSQQVQQICQRAFDLARRGSLYAARAQLIRALNQLVQAMDAAAGSSDHRDQMRAALLAMKEVNDFVPSGGKIVSDETIGDTIQFHSTPVLKDVSRPNGLSATQSYLSFAQLRFAGACGRRSIGSLALFGLGKIELALLRVTPLSNRLHGPKAMAYFQAALMTDQNNYQAANELGVMLARYGRLRDAQEVLLHGISVKPFPESWHNLAVVQQRLGNEPEAKQSQQQSEQLAKKRGGEVLGHQVSWVPLKDFTGPQRLPVESTKKSKRPEAGQKKLVHVQRGRPTPKRRPGWKWPWQ